MSKPNVVYILVDDMGYGDLSRYNKDVSTPNLDRFASNSCILSNCYSSSPVCAPARASILTGRYPHRTGVIDTLETRGYDRLKLSEVTLADVYKENGYSTGLIGKWHLGAIHPEYHPNNRGFDYFFGFRGGWNDYYTYKVERNGTKVDCNQEYLTNVMTKEAVGFIKDNKNNPFFLHVCYNAPHFPLQAPEDVIEKYRKMGKFSEAVCTIYAMIEIMDEGVGAILKTLEECQLTENTIVVFSSDNGPDLGGENPDSKRYNCDLRGEKQMVYEGGIKVPAIVGWANTIEGQVCNEVIHGIDWFPTLLSMCNINYNPKHTIDGQDVSKAFNKGSIPNRQLYWQWNRYSPVIECNAAIRDGALKLIHPPIKPFMALPQWEIDYDVEIKANPEKFTSLVERDIEPRMLPKTVERLLFNLEEDPGETNNIIEQNGEICLKLESDLTAWFEEVETERQRE